MKYIMSWTLKNGTRIECQVFTAESVTRQLLNLEAQGASDIEIKSVSPEDVERNWKVRR